MRILRFQLGVWSPCSKQCGGGQQHRNLTCAQVVSKDVTRVLPESECAHLPRPAGTQGCGNKDCLPEWTVGQWTQVCNGPERERGWAQLSQLLFGLKTFLVVKCCVNCSLITLATIKILLQKNIIIGI